MCMKVAHFYPGLQYKASKIPWRVMKNTHARDAVRHANRLLRRDVEEICRKEGYFKSLQEGLVATFAAQVAVSRHYRDLKKARPADLIVSSSFGNYAGLVMAGSIDYHNLLEFISLQGEITDAYYSRHQTFLLRGIPQSVIQTFAASCADVALIGHSKSEGTAITFPKVNLPTILHFIKYSQGEYAEVPLRLRYHEPFPRELIQVARPAVNKLNIMPPSIPFLSTYGAIMIRSPRKIGDLLVHSVNRPALIQKSIMYTMSLGIEKIIYIKTSGIWEGK